MEAVRPLNIALDMAALQFAEAAGILGGVSVIEAARFYAKNRIPKTEL
jgi:hypothetical protein